jgi:hypothetical protein
MPLHETHNSSLEVLMPLHETHNLSLRVLMALQGTHNLSLGVSVFCTKHVTLSLESFLALQ